MLISVLISINSAYACMPYGASAYVYFNKPHSGINIDALKTYCKPDSCTIRDSTITYRSHFNSNIAIEVSKEKLGIIIPTNDTKFGGMGVEVDIANLSNSQILDMIESVPKKWDARDNFSVLCASGLNCLKFGNCNDALTKDCMFNSDSKISEAKNNGFTTLSFYTEAPLYADENEAKSDIENFLSKYKNLKIISYDSHNVTNYVVEPKEFNWHRAMYLELKTLAKNNILYNISDQDMINIAKATQNDEYVYYRPKSCVKPFLVVETFWASYLTSLKLFVQEGLQQIKELQQTWVSAPANCLLNYKNNCPYIEGCLMCKGVAFELSELPTSTLNLTVPSEKLEK